MIERGGKTTRKDNGADWNGSSLPLLYREEPMYVGLKDMDYAVGTKMSN